MKEITTTFEAYRPLLFSIAYRMLGSVMEAEDLVQEAYLRYLAAGSEQIESPKAYLSTIITRLCLDHLKSAQVQRESYTGPWLPEPLQTADAPEVVVHRKETISMAFLVLLESLSPVERAVFVLREIFDYAYPEIANIVDKSEANCRQLFSRARRRLGNEPAAIEASPQEQQTIITQAMLALSQGDESRLVHLLADEVRMWSDGGGKVTAAGKPLFGRHIVMRFLHGLARIRPENLTMDFIETNGTQSLLLRVDGQLQSVMNFVCRDGKIAEIRTVLNPDKLRHLE